MAAVASARVHLQRAAFSGPIQSQRSAECGIRHFERSLERAVVVSGCGAVGPGVHAAHSMLDAAPPFDEGAVAIPAPESVCRLRARVEHLMVTADGTLLPTLTRLLGASEAFVDRLIWFGAVYYCPVCPLPNLAGLAGRNAAATMELLSQQRAVGLARWGRNTDYSTPRRATSGAMEIHQGGYIRAHVHPKRFPAVYTVPDWKARVLDMGADWVAVDKPPGVQVPPTVDNVRESLLAQVEQALGLAAGSLAPIHRLDAGTSGVVLLSRSPAFSRQVQPLLALKSPTCAGATGGVAAVAGETGGATQKWYRCISRLEGGAPPLGIMRHWARTNVRRPGVPEHTRPVSQPDACPDAKLCELVVMQVERVELAPGPAAQLGATHAYETTLQLVTGRTHQIRMQMAATGRPLLGDRLYELLSASWGTPPEEGDQLPGSNAEVAAADKGPNATGVPPSAAGAAGVAPATSPALPLDPEALHAVVDPRSAIGLQAWRLDLPPLQSFFPGAAAISFIAADPWWRADSASQAVTDV